MADELDPVLEALLRSTLRAEAASVPFRLRAEDVRPTVARTNGPGWRPIILVAAAALVGVAVGGTMLAGSFKPAPRVEPSAPPPAAVTAPLAELPSFDRLAGGIGVPFDHVIARAEGVAAAGSPTMLRADEALPWVAVVFTCDGPGLSFGSAPGGPKLSDVFLPSIECDRGVMNLPVVWSAPDTEHGLVVNARAGTTWRAVVTGRPLDIPERAASSAAVDGLPPFEELLTSRFGIGPEVARGSGVGDAAGTSFTMPALAADRLTLAFVCDDGVAEVALGTRDTLDSGFGFAILPCDSEQPIYFDLPGIERGLDYSTLRIRVSPRSTWEALLAERAAPSASPKSVARQRPRRRTNRAWRCAILGLRLGAIAQLGERLNGIQKVRGSNPRSSTNALSTPTTDPSPGPAGGLVHWGRST